MMVIIPSWLKISRSMFKWKTELYKILSRIWKLLFSTYFYDESGVSCNVIKDKLCSKWFLYFGIPSGV
jgi:hypothetical protein